MKRLWRYMLFYSLRCCSFVWCLSVGGFWFLRDFCFHFLVFLRRQVSSYRASSHRDSSHRDSWHRDSSYRDSWYKDSLRKDLSRKDSLRPNIAFRMSCRYSRNLRECAGFSMMELLFVLVILGILASIALPRISFSRSNALSVAIQSDIQTIISSTQEYAIINEFMPQNANPQWLISYLHLSPQRWIASGDSLKLSKNGAIDSQNDCVSIRFDQVYTLQVLFNRTRQSPLCQNLLKNYVSDIMIPLHGSP